MIPSVKRCTQRNQSQCKSLCKATFMSTACTKKSLQAFWGTTLLSWSPNMDWTCRIKRVTLWPCMMDGVWVVHWMWCSFKRLRWSSKEASWLLALLWLQTGAGAGKLGSRGKVTVHRMGRKAYWDRRKTQGLFECGLLGKRRYTPSRTPL